MRIPFLRLIIIVYHLETQIFVPQQVSWYLWWIKWNLNRFLSGHFGLSLLVSFYPFCIVHLLSSNDHTRYSMSKRQCHHCSKKNLCMILTRPACISLTRSDWIWLYFRRFLLFSPTLQFLPCSRISLIPVVSIAKFSTNGLKTGLYKIKNNILFHSWPDKPTFPNTLCLTG